MPAGQRAWNHSAEPARAVKRARLSNLSASRRGRAAAQIGKAPRPAVRRRSFERSAGGPFRLAGRAVRPLRHVHRSHVDTLAPEAARLRAALCRKHRDKSVAAAGAGRNVIHGFLCDAQFRTTCRPRSLPERYDGAETLPIGALVPDVVDVAIQRDTAAMSSPLSR